MVQKVMFSKKTVLGVWKLNFKWIRHNDHSEVHQKVGRIRPPLRTECVAAPKKSVKGGPKNFFPKIKMRK